MTPAPVGPSPPNGSHASSDAAESRPLNLRRRPDLSISSLKTGNGQNWVVKDPLAMNYVLLRDEENFVLQLLDGRSSLKQIRDQFERRFFPRQLTPSRLQDFLAKLNRESLLVVEGPGQGEQLIRRRAERRQHERLARWTNILAIRFRGVNPERCLNWLYPQVSWLFSWPVALFSLMLVLAAAILVTVQSAALFRQMADLQSLLAPQNILWLAAALAVAKTLHELGHGLACKHFGGSCHELGLLLLVFTPCLYCNVSDAWSFPKKSHRIAVSAAGICVEFVLAAICALLWHFSEPGLFHDLCLNMIVVCCVSSLLINGNPLLKYDGYYVLSDVLGIPNLKEQSSQAARDVMGRWFLGLPATSAERLPKRRRGFLIAYWVASTAYRWFVVIAILWMLNIMAKAYHLELAARAVTLLVILSLPVLAAVQAVQLWRNRVRGQRVSRIRFALTFVVFGAAAVLVLWLPLPGRVDVDVVVQPRDLNYVYASVPGKLVETVRAGQRVQRGQTLARLENVELQFEVQSLQGQLRLQRQHLKNLELRKARDASVAAEILPAAEILADLQQRLDERQADLDRLTLAAPIDGVVLPPPYRAEQSETGQLRAWYGTPLEERNAGCHIEIGTLFCRVGNPDNMEALLSLDETDIQHVREKQRVSITLDEYKTVDLNGTIVEISRSDIDAPRGNPDETRHAANTDNPQSPYYAAYLARVALDDFDARILTGATGQARVHTDPRSLGQRIYETLSRTFRFRL